MNIVLDRPEAVLPRKHLADIPIADLKKLDSGTDAGYVVDQTHGGFFLVTYIDGSRGHFFGDDVKISDLIARMAA